LKAHLHIRIKLPDGSRRYSEPVYSTNRKLRPFFALVDGKPEHHPEGVYHLRFLQNSKHIWKAVGSDAQEALRLQRQIELTMNGQEAGLVIEAPTVLSAGRDLNTAIRNYLSEIEPNHAKATYDLYEYALRLFTECCSKKTRESITREDIIKFRDWLLDDEKRKGSSPRSVSSYLGYIRTSLTHLEIHWPQASKSSKLTLFMERLQPIGLLTLVARRQKNTQASFQSSSVPAQTLGPPTVDSCPPQEPPAAFMDTVPPCTCQKTQILATLNLVRLPPRMIAFL